MLAAAAATLCHALSLSLFRRILLILCYGHFFLCSTSCKLQTGQVERKWKEKQHVYIESAAGAYNDRGREPL